jgi:hypothetical protein
LYPKVTKVFPGNGSLIPLFDAFIVQALPFNLSYEIVVYDSPILNEFWRSEILTTNSPIELFLFFDASYIELNKKYYWRLLVYEAGTRIPVYFSELSSFQITRYN